VTRDVDTQGNCSKCGGVHFGSLECPMSDESLKDIEATATHLTLRALARNPPLSLAASVPIVTRESPLTFEEQLNRSLFGSTREPGWDELRDDARRALMGAEGVDPSAAAKIWETNEALPAAARRTSPKLLKEFNMDNAQLEARTLALPGPKITQKDVIASIVKADYHHFEGTMQTVCCLTLTNGYTVVGSSACADPANFREDLGRDLAYDDACNEVWALLGFRLRENLYQQTLAVAAGVGGLTPVSQLNQDEGAMAAAESSGGGAASAG
jgi:Phage protein (N4 Gp49/phage Sf6 gene 66) family